MWFGGRERAVSAFLQSKQGQSGTKTLVRRQTAEGRLQGVRTQGVGLFQARARELLGEARAAGDHVAASHRNEGGLLDHRRLDLEINCDLWFAAAGVGSPNGVGVGRRPRLRGSERCCFTSGEGGAIGVALISMQLQAEHKRLAVDYGSRTLKKL